MKRSEARYEIGKVLTYLNLSEELQNKLKIKEMEPTFKDLKRADKILNQIEELGMLPPTLKVSKDMYIRSTGEYGYDINEWEPEGECMSTYYEWEPENEKK